jgi:hypothetical protein
MDAKIASKYAAKKRSYWGRHSFDVMSSAGVIVCALVLMMAASYSALIKQARSNWKDNQCNPIYMPFAGSIMPQVGQTNLETTVDNFNYCVHKNVAEAFSILLMPLEFVNFLILTTLDLMIQGMVAAMKLYRYLSKLMDKFDKKTNNSLANFLIPLVLTLTKIRDAMARASAAILTALYTTMTIKSIMVSGLLNILGIVLDLLIILSAVIAGLYAVGGVLCALLATLVPGLVIIGIASSLLLFVFLPFLVIFILLQEFMTATFGSKAQPIPFD